MAKQPNERAVLICRAEVLDGLQSLHITHQKMDQHLKQDPYTCGYREGFEDALQVLAQMVGLLDEFEEAKEKINITQLKHAPVYQGELTIK